MDLRMESEDGLVVSSPEQMCGRVSLQVDDAVARVAAALSQQPGSFREIEEQIGLFYRTAAAACWRRACWPRSAACRARSRPWRNSNRRRSTPCDRPNDVRGASNSGAV